MAEFTFITADEKGRTKKSDNKLVRSICMRGKNKKPESRRSQRRVKQHATPKSRKSKKSQSSSPPRNKTVNTEDYIEENVSGTANALDLTPAYGALLSDPKQDMLMSNASVITLLDNVDTRSRDILMKYIAYSIESNLLYPVERCLDFYHATKNKYAGMVQQDESFLTSSLLTACSLNDNVMRRSMPSALTTQYLRKLLQRLNSQISNLNDGNIRSVVFTIITLGNVAAMFGDYPAASTHLQGLERIVSAHGGKKYLEEYPKFHFKIERLDLSRTLSTGQHPLFRPPSLCPPFSWSPFFPDSTPPSDHLISTFSLTTSAVPKFAIVYSDLRYLTNLINDKVATRTYIPTDLFHGAIHSIQTRLFHLEGLLSDDVAECFRLGMLACLTTTFKLPGRKMEYKNLADNLRHKLQAIRITSLGAQHMVFWVLVMSIVAIFEVDEAWLPQAWEKLLEEGVSWEEVRTRLRNAIWITCIHDKPAEQAFEKFELRRKRKAGVGGGE
ncbi:hypothetical protein CC80DRAFT_544176 [Byssothecium circinans]|uniref:Tachykinin family protein n=1 Tax=Byssothecium circinans TaxID=147558 RepID=A0A6A5UAC5_9PLEO|nr:hypothetical protein CC80DRAFT_544176 [Byssothecium circinans]